MDILVSRWANESNLKRVEFFLGLEAGSLARAYQELIADEELIDLANSQMDEGRRLGFSKAIFSKPRVDGVDWFAFERILLYVLVRHFRPAFVWETGVYYGGNSLFILRALQRNGYGTLVSAELPATRVADPGASRHPWVGETEDYDTEALPVGFLVPSALRENWDLRIGSSLELLPNFPGPCDLFIHDSDHSMDFLEAELSLIADQLSPDGLVVVDDIDWSNAFFSFASRNGFYPLLLTDNGKDDLRVRIGMVANGQRFNGIPAVTGTIEANG